MHNNERFIEKYAIPLLATAILAVLFLLYLGSMKSIKTDGISQPLVEHNPFENISLTAQSAIVWDIKHQRALFELNASQVLPLASLTKVMTAITASELMPEYTVVPISKEFLAEEGDSGLHTNEKWALKDLLSFSLAVSSNDASRAVASVIGSLDSGAGDFTTGRTDFISRMNEKAEKMGLLNTVFLNDNGLDVDSYQSGGYGTARDVARMFEYALRHHPDIVEATRTSRTAFSSLDNIAHSARNTNMDIDNIPGVLGSKTGYTSLAGGNLVIAFDSELGRPLVVSVLGSTADGRFSDVRALVKASRDYMAQEHE